MANLIIENPAAELKTNSLRHLRMYVGPSSRIAAHIEMVLRGFRITDILRIDGRNPQEVLALQKKLTAEFNPNFSPKTIVIENAENLPASTLQFIVDRTSRWTANKEIKQFLFIGTETKNAFPHALRGAFFVPDIFGKDSAFQGMILQLDPCVTMRGDKMGFLKIVANESTFNACAFPHEFKALEFALTEGLKTKRSLAFRGDFVFEEEAGDYWFRIKQVM